MQAEYNTFTHSAAGLTVKRTQSYSLPTEVAACVDFVAPTVHVPRPAQPKNSAPSKFLRRGLFSPAFCARVVLWCVPPARLMTPAHRVCLNAFIHADADSVKAPLLGNTPKHLRELYNSTGVEGKADDNKMAVTAFLNQKYKLSDLQARKRQVTIVSIKGLLDRQCPNLCVGTTAHTACCATGVLEAVLLRYRVRQRRTQARWRCHHWRFFRRGGNVSQSKKVSNENVLSEWTSNMTFSNSTLCRLDIESITGVAGNVEAEFWGFSGHSPDDKVCRCVKAIPLDRIRRRGVHLHMNNTMRACMS